MLVTEGKRKTHACTQEVMTIPWMYYVNESLCDLLPYSFTQKVRKIIIAPAFVWVLPYLVTTSFGPEVPVCE